MSNQCGSPSWRWMNVSTCFFLALYCVFYLYDSVILRLWISPCIMGKDHMIVMIVISARIPPVLRIAPIDFTPISMLFSQENTAALNGMPGTSKLLGNIPDRTWLFRVHHGPSIIPAFLALLILAILIPYVFYGGITKNSNTAIQFKCWHIWPSKKTGAYRRPPNRNEIRKINHWMNRGTPSHHLFSWDFP